VRRERSEEQADVAKQTYLDRVRRRSRSYRGRGRVFVIAIVVYCGELWRRRRYHVGQHMRN
jgi:hypothetical protein